MQRHSFQALNSTFVVDSEYQFVKELGQGAYGCVVSAKHRRSGEGCAIKKITNINTKVRPFNRSYDGPGLNCFVEEDSDQTVFARDQVRRSPYRRKCLLCPQSLTTEFLGFCITSVVIRMSVFCNIDYQIGYRSYFFRLHVSTTWTSSSVQMATSTRFIYMYVHIHTGSLLRC